MRNTRRVPTPVARNEAISLLRGICGRNCDSEKQSSRYSKRAQSDEHSLNQFDTQKAASRLGGSHVVAFPAGNGVKRPAYPLAKLTKK